MQHQNILRIVGRKFLTGKLRTTFLVQSKGVLLNQEAFPKNNTVSYKTASDYTRLFYVLPYSRIPR